jgi:hypothetical protein
LSTLPERKIESLNSFSEVENGNQNFLRYFGTHMAESYKKDKDGNFVQRRYKLFLSREVSGKVDSAEVCVKNYDLLGGFVSCLKNYSRSRKVKSSKTVIEEVVGNDIQKIHINDETGDIIGITSSNADNKIVESVTFNPRDGSLDIKDVNSRRSENSRKTLPWIYVMLILAVVTTVFASLHCDKLGVAWVGVLVGVVWLIYVRFLYNFIKSIIAIN